MPALSLKTEAESEPKNERLPPPSEFVFDPGADAPGIAELSETGATCWGTRT